MLMLSKFVYELTGCPLPHKEELDDEIDRLLYIKGAEEPNYLTNMEQRDQLSNLDSEVISLWINRKFQPALILLLLDSDDNHQEAKTELSKMERYKKLIDKFLRVNFVSRRAMQRMKELCFDNPNSSDIQKSILVLKKTLVFVSEHLQRSSPDSFTLLGTDTYTPADVLLYNYLKRIVCSNYKDYGLKTHVRLCDPLKRFMSRYASKNTHVIDVSSSDPLADDRKESSLASDMIKPGIVAAIIVLFFMWRQN